MDNVPNKPKPPRPKRVRSRRDGRNVLVKRPDAAGNARPAKAYIFHGLGSGFLKDRHDLRSAVGKATHNRAAALVAHTGGDPNVAFARLIQHAARYSVLSDALWARLAASTQEIAPETLAGLLDAMVKINQQERETLKLLGLARAKKPIESLPEYLARKAAEQEQPPDAE